MENIRLFETEELYEQKVQDLQHPTISYVIESDKCYVYQDPNNIDISKLETHLVLGNYYKKEIDAIMAVFPLNGLENRLLNMWDNNITVDADGTITEDLSTNNFYNNYFKNITFTDNGTVKNLLSMVVIYEDGLMFKSNGAWVYLHANGLLDGGSGGGPIA